MSLLCVTIDAISASNAIRDAGGAALACLPSVAAGTRARVEALAAERDALVRERDESRAVLGALAAAASDARTSLDAARGDMAARAAETAALREEIDALHGEAATLRERLERARASVAAAAREDALSQTVTLVESKGRSGNGAGSVLTPPGGAPPRASVASPPQKSLLAAEAAAASSAASATAAGRDAADARTDAAYWRARAERAEALADQLSGVVSAQADALCDAAYAGEQRLRESDADWVRCGGGEQAPSRRVNEEGGGEGEEGGSEYDGVGEGAATTDSSPDYFATRDTHVGQLEDGTTFAQRAMLLAHAFGAHESGGVLRASRRSISPLSATRPSRAKSPPPPAPRLVEPPKEAVCGGLRVAQEE